MSIGGATRCSFTNRQNCISGYNSRVHRRNFVKLHFNCVHNYNLNANQVINKLFNKKVFIFRTVSRF